MSGNKDEVQISDHALSEDQSIVHCRQIGLQNPIYKRYWPSAGKQLNVVFGDGVSASFQKSIEPIIRNTYSQVLAEIDVELAGRTTFVVANGPSEFVRLVRAHAAAAPSDISQVARDRCNSFRNVSALAYPGLIAICRADRAEIGREIDPLWARFLIGHELFHDVQWQLSGYSGARSRDGMNIKFDGPAWLVEGSAQWAADRVTVTKSPAEHREYVVSRLLDSTLDLSRLERGKELQRRKPEVYKVGRLAAHDLWIQAGAGSFGNFYEQLGRGMPWQEAFKAAFGQSLQSFYSRFKQENSG